MRRPITSLVAGTASENSADPSAQTYLRLAEMGTVRYIGSKARIVDELLDIIGPPGVEDGFFVDAFCGTGAVGAKAADFGWPVRLNDNLTSAIAVSTARLLSPADVPFAELGGYAAVISQLNAAVPVQSFFWREYSPAGPTGRQYFTEANAGHIDAVRKLITSWKTAGQLNRDEHDLLVADLISAAGRIANIAGTYGCYLARWTPGALRPFSLQARELRQARVPHEAYCGDVIDTPMAENDVVYFDPPYTKRQYAAYYHVNETLACGDEPELIGKTGLRPWQEKASAYCYKSRALRALTELIENTPARRIFLSYSSEGHVALDDLQESLAPLGDLNIHQVGDIGRYRPNRAARDAASDVTEYLVELNKAPVELEVAS